MKDEPLGFDFTDGRTANDPIVISDDETTSDNEDYGDGSDDDDDDDDDVELPGKRRRRSSGRNPAGSKRQKRTRNRVSFGIYKGWSFSRPPKK